MADCGVMEFACKAGETVAGFLGDLAKGATEGVGKAIGGFGTMWVRVDVPELTDRAATSAVAPGEHGDGAEGLVTVLGYVSWTGAFFAVLSLTVLGVLFAVRRDQGIAITDRIVVVLAAVFVISGGTAFVAKLVPQGPMGVGGAVHFLQASTWWYTLTGALLGVLIGGTRMIIEQRARAGRDVVQSLVTLIVVAAAGVTVVNLLITAADGFSTWILSRSLDCELDSSGTCFGATISKLIVVAGVGSIVGGSFGPLLVILLALFALVVVLIQILVMIMRGALLVALCGVLPLSASATNTQRGKAWFEKVVSWILAFILYKPAAAIVYATAFRLAGTDPSDSANAVVTALSGITLLVLALLALPALIRTVVPAVSAVAGAAGGGAVAGALAATAMANPTGAVDLAKRGLDVLKGSGGGASGAVGGSGGGSGGGAGGGLSGGGSGTPSGSAAAGSGPEARSGGGDVADGASGVHPDGSSVPGPGPSGQGASSGDDAAPSSGSSPSGAPSQAGPGGVDGASGPPPAGGERAAGTSPSGAATSGPGGTGASPPSPRAPRPGGSGVSGASVSGASVSGSSGGPRASSASGVSNPPGSTTSGPPAVDRTRTAPPEQSAPSASPGPSGAPSTSTPTSGASAAQDSPPAGGTVRAAAPGAARGVARGAARAGEHMNLAADEVAPSTHDEEEER